MLGMLGVGAVGRLLVGAALLAGGLLAGRTLIAVAGGFIIVLGLVALADGADDRR